MSGYERYRDEVIESARNCISRLSQSDKGRNAMRRVLEWLDGDGLSLEWGNREAIIMLLREAWLQPMAVREMIREAVTNG